jgi:hypothetical protein
MTKANPAARAAAAPRRFLPALLLLFAASGCSALIYEIVWYQLLQLVIGSTAVSLGVLLATFMGGLCIGSVLLPRILPVSRHPLRMYAYVELGIALCGILVLIGMPLVSGVYVAAVGYGLPSILLRAVICAICLLPPTALMGASLPTAARWLETSPEGVSWMGLLYGSNTAGAVFGCLLAGFYLLREFDLTTATIVAVAINVAVALISLLHLLAGIRGDRTIRGERIRGRGRLDAPAGTDVRRYGLRILTDPGGIFGGTRNRQSGGIAGTARDHASAPRLGLLPDGASRGGRMERLDDFQFTAVLAHQPLPLQQSLVHIPTGSGALLVGHTARCAALGSKLSFGPGGLRAGWRSGPPGRAGICDQYRRRDPGRAGIQHDPDSQDRYAV